MAKRYGIGMAGTLVVVLALIGTVLGGFCTDVSQATRDTLDYNYITDVTGLFDIGQTPEYIAYNPGANFVGYDPNKVVYSPSGVVNQYRYELTPGSTTTQTVTINKDSSYTNVNWLGTSYEQIWGCMNLGWGEYWDGATIYGQYCNAVIYPQNPGDTWTEWKPRMTSLTTVFNAMNLSSYQTAEITISYGTYPTLIVPYSAWSLLADGNIGGHTSAYYHKAFDLYTPHPNKITINIPTGVATAYNGTSQVWVANMSDVMVIYDYSAWRGTVFLDPDITNNRYPVTSTWSVTAQNYPTYGYADPEGGVVFGTSPADWQNGYQNDEIYITVAGQSAGSNNLTVTAGSSSVTITKSATGTYVADVVNADASTDTKVIGKWSAAQLHINASQGTLSITPINGTPSYTNPVEEGSTTIVWDSWYSGGDLSQLTFSSTGTSLRWGVTATTVFLNTYGAVMQDPTLDIADYFPDMTDWRLNFYSFALVGNSITVNGVTYSVNPTDQTVTIAVGDESISGVISNISVTKYDGDLIFTFEDSGESINLGTATDTEVSFGGRWYFTTGLFDVVPGFETYYDWNLDGKWHATGGQAVVMFLGLLSIGTLIAKGLYKISLKSADGLILVMASVIALIMGGTMI